MDPIFFFWFIHPFNFLSVIIHIQKNKGVGGGREKQNKMEDEYDEECKKRKEGIHLPGKASTLFNFLSIRPEPLTLR